MAGPAVAGKVQVTVTTLDRCWFEVYVDGKQVLAKTLPRGTTSTWAGEREVVLQEVGREWAVEVMVNGRELGRLTALATRLQREPLTVEFDGGRVKVTLARRYLSGVLVGLRFSLQK